MDIHGYRWMNMEIDMDLDGQTREDGERANRSHYGPLRRVVVRRLDLDLRPGCAGNHIEYRVYEIDAARFPKQLLSSSECFSHD